MSSTQQKEETEDVMALLSVGSDYDITNEEEDSLLQMSEDMNVDNHNTSVESVRQKIVFDIDDSICESQHSHSDHVRYKFNNEKNSHNTCSTFNQSSRPKIADSLHFVNTNNLFNKKTNTNRRRFRNRYNSRPNQINHNNRFNDLREVIANNRNCINPNNFVGNRLLRNELNISNLFSSHSIPVPVQALLNNSLNLQLLTNASPYLAQSSLFDPNSLLALSQIQRNKFNRNYTQMQTPVYIPNKTLNYKNAEQDKQQIKITISNTCRPQPPKISTIPKLCCTLNNDELKNTESDQSQNNQDIIEIERKIASKIQLKAKLVKHLPIEANETKQMTKHAATSDSFAEALAEVEVGVDNEYLMKMEEVKKKRFELQRLKEERRYEMADQRLQEANDMQQKLKMFKRSDWRHRPY